MVYDWLITQLDYMIFLHGLVLVLLALAAFRLTGRPHLPHMPWRWLGVFGLVGCLRVWCGLLEPDEGLSQAGMWIGRVLLVLAFAALLEFCIRGWKAIAERPWALWLGLPLLVLCSLSLIVSPWRTVVVGMPAQVLGVVCASCCMVIVWSLWQPITHEEESVARSGRWIVPLAMALTAGMGWVGIDWHCRVIDRDMRERVMRQAIGLARTIKSADIRTLAFAPADTNSPQFRRIGTHMAAYGRYLGNVRGIYSFALRRGHLVFGPESYAPSDKMASPPGTVFEKPSPRDLAVFTEAVPYVDGPRMDEYGSFVSGIAPVCERFSGAVPMVVGIDILANQWMRHIAIARLSIILLIFILCVILLATAFLLYRRQSLPIGRCGWLMRHIEVLLAVTLGLLLTIVLAGGVHSIETHAVFQNFDQLADARLQVVNEAFTAVRRDLADVARVLEANLLATDPQFKEYVNPLIRPPGVRAWAWLTCTTGDTTGPLSCRLAAHAASDSYSLQAVKSLETAAYRALMMQAKQSGMAVATPPIKVFTTDDAAGTDLVLVFHPVYNGERTQLRGFALCVLHVPSMLVYAQNSAGETDSRIAITLTDITDAPASAQVDPQRGTTDTHPLLLFGRTWIAAARPGPAFLREHRTWQGAATGLAGLLVTIFVAAFVGALRTRQAMLEHQVSLRTSQLQASEERFRDIAESMAECIWETDTNGQFTWCSHVETTILGYRPEELMGKSIYDLMEPAEADRVRSVLAQFMLWKAPLIDLENWRIAKDGRRVCMSTSGVPVLDDMGDLLGYRGVDDDITERKQAESNRIKMERLLLHGQKLESLGILAGGIAHDFNNLLMAIMGRLDIALFDLAEDSPVREAINHAMQAGNRATTLTSALLAYAGKGRFVMQPVDIGAVVRENAEMFRMTVAKTAVLKVDVPASLPLIQADPAQVQQVVMNMISNASDALETTPGSIVLEARVMNCDAAFLARTRLASPPPPGTFVSLAVTDTGCGMDDATQQRLFDPFFTTKVKGRGLGMSTTLGILSSHKGAIMVDSAPGRGTRIQILFPVTAA